MGQESILDFLCQISDMSLVNFAFSLWYYLLMNSLSGSQPEHDTSYYEHISPTAFVIAYERTFTDIPFSNEIFSLLKNKEVEGRKAVAETGLSNLAPRYEARFKLVSKLLDETGNSNIIEIAPGMSPRGIIYCTKNAGAINYVELDLPHMSTLKSNIINEVCSSFNLRANGLKRIAGNALVSSDLDKAATQLDNNAPITFICEGLMRYFDFDEKRQLATNILHILHDRGGTWITPDITLKSFSSGIMKAIEQRVSDISGINMEQNYFDTVEQAITFFSDIGFNVMPRSFLEVRDNISSASELRLTDASLNTMLGSSTAFVMTPKTSSSTS